MDALEVKELKAGRAFCTGSAVLVVKRRTVGSTVDKAVCLCRVPPSRVAPKSEAVTGLSTVPTALNSYR